MRESGVISEILDNNSVKVQFAGNSYCEKCGMCLKSGNTLFVIAENTTNSKVGDRVEVEIEPRKVLWSTLLVFIMPIVCLIIGYYLAGIIFSFIFMFAYFMVLFFYDRYFIDKNPVCKIVKAL